MWWWMACGAPADDVVVDWRHPAPEAKGEGSEEEAETEERAHAEREQWVEQLHRAPPDVAWRSVEHANAEAMIEGRNRYIKDGQPERWVERGSENQAGRMWATRRSVDGTRLYAGSAHGGLWAGNLDGTGWTPLGDVLYGGVHFLEVIPGSSADDTDILMVAASGGFVHRSVDDGLTWTVPAGLPAKMTGVRRLVASADGDDTLWMVVVVDNNDVRLLRSTDGGASFEQAYDFGYWWGDVWLSRAGPSAVYLLAKDGLYVSNDGDRFDWLSEVPRGGWGGELVGSEAGAPTLYALSHQDSGAVVLSRSDDAGATVRSLGPIEDYYGTFAASVVEPSLVAWGGVELHVSHDGGETSDIVNSWGAYYGDPARRLHADIFGLDCLPVGGDEVWYIGTDGGTYVSTDKLDTVTNLSLSGLRVSQYYDTHTSSANPDNLVAGSQDQGYQASYSATSDGRLSMEQTLSGDYAHLTSGDGDHEPIYSVYPGFILVQTREDDAGALAYLNYPDGEAAAWLPPIVGDPDDDEAFFFPNGHIWRYVRTSRDNWEPERWSDQSFVQNDGEFVGAMVFSPVDAARAYAVTSWGRLFVSDDHARTWAEAPNTGPSGQYFYGAALWASWTDRDVAYVGGSGYGRVPSVLRTVNGGKSWDVFDEGLPDTLVYDLAEARDGSGRLFAATETAAYERDPGGEWFEITSSGAPVTTYWSVEALPAENTIRFATYGRGIWDYQLDPDGTGCFPPVDRDGDGARCDVDCDDYDAGRFPGNAEACDGVDADCGDAVVDESDEDADGTPACADCDDADPDRFVGATDVCGDGRDQDCDGEDARCRGCGCAAASGSSGGASIAALAAIMVWTSRRRGGGGRRPQATQST
jgi:hypothetical protein